MLFNTESEFFSSNSEIEGAAEHDGVEMLSAWELSFLDNGNPISALADTEAKLAAELISSKITLASADRSIYRKYCPVCRSRGITAIDEIYDCAKCTSSYMFSETDENAKVWFRKIRK